MFDIPNNTLPLSFANASHTQFTFQLRNHRVCKNKFCSLKYNDYICIPITKSNFSSLQFMDLVSRLKQYLATRGISITQFADECEIPRPSASQLLAGRNKKVSDEIIGKIHYTYPELSVTWLMFGEGDMVTTANIETSERQIAPAETSEERQNVESQAIETTGESLFSVDDSDAEKSDSTQTEEFSFAPNTFAFGNHPAASAQTHPAATVTQPAAPQPSAEPDTNANKQGRPITLTPNNGKCVTGIVVYYSDSTYESFVPDPEAKHPFMR